MTNKGADNVSDPMDWAAGRAEMTQPNEQLIATIQRAIADQSEYGLDVIRENGTEWLRALLEENKRLNDFLKEEQQDLSDLQAEYMKECALLQQTREELEKAHEANKTMSEQYHRIRGLYEVRGNELEQVKAERDDKVTAWRNNRDEWKLEAESLHAELAAKDKVLQWYELQGIIDLGCEEWDVGLRARQVLSSYPPREKGATE